MTYKITHSSGLPPAALSSRNRSASAAAAALDAAAAFEAAAAARASSSVSAAIAVTAPLKNCSSKLAVCAVFSLAVMRGSGFNLTAGGDFGAREALGLAADDDADDGDLRRPAAVGEGETTLRAAAGDLTRRRASLSLSAAVSGRGLRGGDAKRDTRGGDCDVDCDDGSAGADMGRGNSEKTGSL